MDSLSIIMSQSIETVQFKDALDNFCTFLLKYQHNLDEINNQNLGSFKNHHKSSYEVLKLHVNKDFNVDNLASNMYDLFMKYDFHLINNPTLSILHSFLNNRFKSKLEPNQASILADKFKQYNQDNVNIDSQIDFNNSNKIIHQGDSILNILLDLNDTFSNAAGVQFDQLQQRSRFTSSTTSTQHDQQQQQQQQRQQQQQPQPNNDHQQQLSNPSNQLTQTEFTTDSSNNKNEQQHQPIIQLSKPTETQNNSIQNKIIGSQQLQIANENSQVTQLDNNITNNNNNEQQHQANLTNQPQPTNGVNTNNISNNQQPPISPIQTLQPTDDGNTNNHNNNRHHQPNIIDNKNLPSTSNINNVNNNLNQNTNLIDSINLLVSTINKLPDLVDHKINQRFDLKMNNLQNMYISNSNNTNQTMSCSINNHNPSITIKQDKNQLLKELSITIKKILKTENNINILKSHMINNTTPSSINHQRFPKPFLWHNDVYVVNYNQMLEKFQTEIMKFNTTELETHKIKLLEKFKTLRIEMQLSNQFNDIAKLIESTYRQCEAELKPLFAKSDKKVKNIQTKKYVTKKIFFNDSYDSINHSSSSDDDIVVIETNDNNNKPNEKIMHMTSKIQQNAQINQTHKNNQINNDTNILNNNNNNINHNNNHNIYETNNLLNNNNNNSNRMNFNRLGRSSYQNYTNRRNRSNSQKTDNRKRSNSYNRQNYNSNNSNFQTSSNWNYQNQNKYSSSHQNYNHVNQYQNNNKLVRNISNTFDRSGINYSNDKINNNHSNNFSNSSNINKNSSFFYNNNKQFEQQNFQHQPHQHSRR